MLVSTVTEQHDYIYASGKLLRETVTTTEDDTSTTETLDFFYDANGTPYALKVNGTTYYYVTNLQGDVVRLVNSSGTAVASYEYDPYGNIISQSGALADTNPLRYRSYYFDSESGFYYLQSRYYDPTIGRFINADSYASTGQGILGYNMFAYCGNNPVNASDPTGHKYVSVLQHENSYYVAGGGGLDLLALFECLKHVLKTVAAACGAIATGTLVSNSIQQEKSESEAKVEAKVSSAEPSAIYYGVDLYGGNFNIRTGPMLFEDAANWATATAASGIYSSRASWGLYTLDQLDAMSMAIYLGTTGPVPMDEAHRNHLAHFHTSNREIVSDGQRYCARSFHIWFG